MASTTSAGSRRSGLGGNIAQEIVHRDAARVAALVVADATCNTSARHGWQTPMAIATLAGLGVVAREPFLQATATVTARDPEVPARFQTKPPACYRAPWRLPGPDFHRQATTSLRTRSTATSRLHLLLCWAHAAEPGCRGANLINR